MKQSMIVVCAILALFSSFANSQTGVVKENAPSYEMDFLVRPVQFPKISQALQRQLNSSEQESFKVWIFFSDKGIFTKDQYESAITNAEKRLTDRARKRRLKISQAGKLIDFEDLRVSENHIEAVLQLGVKHRTTSRWLNAISVEATSAQVYAIAELDFVSSLKPVASYHRYEPAPKKSSDDAIRDTLDYGLSYDQLAQLNVPAVHELGYSGSGVLITMLDTGFELTHEALVNMNVIAEWDFIHDDSNTAYDPLQDDPSQPWHGTITLSTVGGFMEGQLIGPAYGAAFALAKTEEITFEQPIEEDWWVEGIEWADSLGTDIVSSSLGYYDWYTYEDFNGDSCVTTIGADEAASKGIIVCDAIGNNGQWVGSLIAPSDADSIIAVGAVDRSGFLASFSSIGPTYDGRIKPEVVALGVDVYAVDPGDDHGYLYASGTSLATPLAAGVSALLVGAHPDWNNMQVREAIMMTASQSTSPDNYLGWGIPDALAALNYDAGIEENESPALLASSYLASNYPNPFRSSTTIEYSIPFSSFVSLVVYDIRGSLIKKLVFEKVEAGHHLSVWDRSDQQGNFVQSGVYFYCLSVNAQTQTRKMIVIQ